MIEQARKFSDEAFNQMLDSIDDTPCTAQGVQEFERADRKFAGELGGRESSTKRCCLPGPHPGKIAQALRLGFGPQRSERACAKRKLWRQCR